MSRWINETEFLVALVNKPRYSSKTIGEALDEAPSIDIVRCKECKHWYGESEMYEDREYKKCHQLCGQYMNADFWCKYGERSGDE